MKWFGFLLILSSMSTTFAQNEDVVLNLSATEYNGKVLLTWSVTQGNTCNGITVLHATDTNDYHQVGTIEGICGSTAETIAYEFTDASPSINQTNYYKLNLGGIGFSYAVHLDVIDAGAQTYIVSPNPVSDQSQLIFNNENQEVVMITFYNERGETVYQESSSEQSMFINRTRFTQGVYFFVLTSDGFIEPFSGRFVVM